MTDTVEYPDPVQPEDVLADDEPATCGQSVPIDNVVVVCRLRTHRQSNFHLGTQNVPGGGFYPWTT